MRARTTFGLALTLSVASCQAPSVNGPGVVGPSQGPGKVAASVAPASKPAAVVPTVPPTSKPAGLLRPLTGAVATLAGQVLVDGDYASRLGGGKLVSNAGGMLALLGGGKLIGNDGSTLIGNDGSTLVTDGSGRAVAAAGGNVIVPAGLIGLDGSTLIGLDGSTLIGNDGSTLVGNDGGSLIGNDGSTLIGNDGSTLIGNDGGSLLGSSTGAMAVNGSRYGLRQAPDATVGQGTPGVGMWVSAVDTRTGFTVPLGTDADGKSVYTVYTDITGSFKAQVAAEVADHVRIVARAPGLRDRRLVMAAFAVRDTAATIDDDHVAVTTFWREAIRGRMFNSLSKNNTEAAATGEFLVGLGLADVTRELAALREVLSERALEELSYILTDAVLAGIDVDSIQLSEIGTDLRNPASIALAGHSAVKELGGVLRRVREATLKQTIDANATANPAIFFSTKPYLVAANMSHASDARYRIDRPADMADFIVHEFFGSNIAGHREKANLVFDDLGLDLMDRDRIGMAAGGLVTAIVTGAVQTAEGGVSINDQMLAIIHNAGEKLKTAKLPAPLPHEAPPLPMPPSFGAPRVVDTIAGLAGVPVVADQPVAQGPGLTTAMGAPLGLALDQSVSPPVLYVSDAARQVIHRLTFDAAGSATVSTLPGAGQQFGGYMAHDGKGHLYVTSSATLTVIQVSTRAEDLGTVTPIAGGVRGFLDGPGANAQFGNPCGIEIDPGSGDLFVADLTNRRIRRIGMSDPSHPVTTFIGTGSPFNVDGPIVQDTGTPLGGTVDAPRHPGATTDLPMNVAFDTQGSLIFLDRTGLLRQVAAPFTPTSRTRFLAGGGLATDEDTYYSNGALHFPSVGLDADPKGGLVVAEAEGHRIRYVTPDGWVHLIAGGGPLGVIGSYADGVGSAARFSAPSDVAVAKDGTIYVADFGNSLIRRIKP